MLKKYFRKICQIILLIYDKFIPTKGIVTLLYHKTTNENKTPSIVNIDLKTFETQVKYLKYKGYRTLTISEIFNILYKNERIPKKSIIITFDDGYKDNLAAFTILQKYGYSAICFTATAFINEKLNFMPFWYDNESTNLKEPRVKNQEFYFLELEDYKVAIKLGVEFASHTNHHVDLSKISDFFADKEIEQSKKIVENIIGKKSLCFSYPFGLVGENSAKILQKNGIKIAFGVFPGTIIRDTDPLLIPRHNVPKEWLLFKLVLTDKYSIYKKISDNINKISI